MINSDLILLVTFVFIFGMMIGSFLNVVIYRVPRKMSVVTPRSRCTKCNKLIYWHENIPVISYILLRGKCSKCGVHISMKYPFVEILTGAAALVVMSEMSGVESIPFFLIKFGVACVFIAHFFIDLEHKILPDVLNIYLALLFLVYSIFVHPWTFWLSGAAIGFGFPYAVAWGFYLLTKKEGLGFGDVKLLGALGIYLGPMGVIHNIFFSCFLGSIVGIALIVSKKMDKNTHIPFGPYIISVASLQIFFPDFFKVFSQFM